MIAQHSSNSNEWYTPMDIADRAAALMGGIDLDPASCSEANRTIRARCYYTKESDGLTHPWFGNVFLNPPGGKIEGKSSMQVWWNHLANEYEFGQVPQGFFVAFTLEILRTSQQGIPAQKYFRCYPKDRIHFNGAGSSPTHANVLIWLPPKDERNFTKFKNLFEEVGYCEAGS